MYSSLGNAETIGCFVLAFNELIQGSTATAGNGDPVSSHCIGGQTAARLSAVYDRLESIFQP